MFYVNYFSKNLGKKVNNPRHPSVSLRAATETPVWVRLLTPTLTTLNSDVSICWSLSPETITMLLFAKRWVPTSLPCTVSNWEATVRR